MRKLASIQKIASVHPIEGADSIETIVVLGWHLVAKIGEFKVGDLCVYCEVDSILPEHPLFEFLRPRHFRIKTIKLKGQISQGIAFPTNVLSEFDCKNLEITEGIDVTNILGITQYESPTDVSLESGPGVFVLNWPRRALNGIWRMLFRRNYYRRAHTTSLPSFVRKTDEVRIQTVPWVLEQYSNVQYYVSEKIDGCSISLYLKRINGKPTFGVCSRRFDLAEGGQPNMYWMAAKKYDIEKKLREYYKQTGKELVLQGELVGPKIQGNKYHRTDYEIYFFNVFIAGESEYINYVSFKSLMLALDLPTVPIINEIFWLNGMTVEELVKMSSGTSKIAKTKREGIVIRPLTEIQVEKFGRLSFKVVDPYFLLKYQE